MLGIGEMQYGWFQSLLQLSVGLNLTFAALLSLFDAPLDRELNLTKSVLRGARDLHGQLVNRPNGDTRVISEVIGKATELQDRVLKHANRTRMIMYSLVRPVSVLCALASLWFLLVASFNSGSYTYDATALVSVGTLLPLVLFAMYAVVSSVIIEYSVSSQRKLLDDAILESQSQLTTS